MQFTEFETLASARDRVAIGREHGMTCPCCDQYIKIYYRKLNSAMAFSLILIDRYFKGEGAEEWLHVEHYLKANPRIDCHDFPKLRFWGLLEVMKGQREDGSKRLGYYKITSRGRQFVRREISVPKKAIILIDNAIGFSEEMTNIVEALGSKFDYQELMEARA